MTLIPSEITVYSMLIIINHTLLLCSSAWPLDMKSADKIIKTSLWEEEIRLFWLLWILFPSSMAPCRYSHTLTLNSPRKGHVIHCMAHSMGCSLAWFWPMPVAISPSSAQLWGQHRPETFLNRLHGWSYLFLRSSCPVPHTVRTKALALAYCIYWKRHASPPTKQCRKDGLLGRGRSGAHTSWISLPVHVDLTNFFSIKLWRYFIAFCADEIIYWSWGKIS